ncbi:MAG TPA: di-heme oxidoredictase family protein [Polyangiaceae bacterium]|nr:di-heme oxidoredictase family protein [Polyangiaceae bacterium]
MQVRKLQNCATLVALVVAAAGAACGGTAGEGDETVVQTTEAVTVGGFLPGLTSAQQTLFTNGAAAFEVIEGISDGLGPLFNEKSCGTCHAIGAEGGSGVQFEVRGGILSGTSFNDLANEGGQLFQLHDVTGMVTINGKTCSLPGMGNGEPVPANANVSAKRRTTALFGLGLVDATPDSTFVALAASEPAATRGTVNMIANLDKGGATTMGKFGWKAQVPTLHQFAGDAYLHEEGITNPQFPTNDPPFGNTALVAPCNGFTGTGLEDNGADITNFTNFMQLLAPPKPSTPNAQTTAGQAVFTRIGCGNCHTPSITSGSNAVAALSNQTYHPYSDFLVHDMGTLGDKIGNNGLTTPTQMRTAPLWGLVNSNQSNLLHDGRAHSLASAIQQHAGQGAAAAAAFNALNSTDSNNLLAFLNSI